MIFLIEYDRRGGELRRMREYDDDHMTNANADRLTSEIENVANTGVEIVILRSESIEQLKRTHARYFATLRELEKGFRARQS